MARVGAVATAVVAMVFLTAGPAAAHAVLVSSDPRDGADLPAAPVQVSITFDEAVGLRPGYLRVIDGTGRRVDTGTAVHPSGRDDVVTVDLRRGLGRAAYVASYRVVSADSHAVSGAIRFTVGGAAPTTARPAGGGTDAFVSVLFDGARTITFFGLALFGGAWLLLVARRRAVTVTNPPGHTAPGRAWRTVRAGAVLSLGGLGAEFLLQGPYAAGRAVTATVDPTLLEDTLTSAFGRWHVIGLGLMAVLAVAVFRRPRGPADGHGGPRGSAYGRRALVVLAAMAWLAVLTCVAESGHAGVRSPVWLGLPVTITHLLAMSSWIGGLAVLAIVVLPDAGRAGAWTALLPVFSRVAMVCVAALAATGTYQAWQEVGSWSALFDTTYGELVLTKIELFAVLVALGAVARSRVAAWPTGPGGSDEPTTRRRVTAARQLRTGVLVELGVAVAVLCVSAVLVAEPPGRDTALAARASAGVTVTVPLSATRTLTVAVIPARHGTVVVDLTVSAGAPVQKLTLAAVQSVAGVGPLPVAVRATAAGGYRSAPVDLPVAGDWQFDVAVQTSAFDVATATPTLHLD